MATKSVTKEEHIMESVKKGDKINNEKQKVSCVSEEAVSHTNTHNCKQHKYMY